MELRKLHHYIRRTLQLGPRVTISLVNSRIKQRLFDHYWRKKAANKKASHTWKDILKKHPQKRYGDFNQFWQEKKQKLPLLCDELYLYRGKEVVDHAYDYVHNYFSILGSGKKQYTAIPWHYDIRLQELDSSLECSFDATCYYKDVSISAGEDTFVKDIKVPWELSRLQHFFVLGHAYKQTNDEFFAQAFVNHTNDWFRHTHFLLGPSWSCPMDVGIRAVNLIWALAFFKESSTLTLEFLQKVSESLYDHLFYLENNWEVYDFRTSNHYLSDLIGYFYLCDFFSDLPGIAAKAGWCYQELLKEFEKQIFNDGSDYEGSTSYHSLITEIFYHSYILGKKMGFIFLEAFEEKLALMFTFIEKCTPAGGTLIRIGDNDSGKLLYYGLSPQLIERMKKSMDAPVVHYKEFGLSVVKTDEIHYSLRHHVYTKRQPSGHFHNDYASMTCSFKGIDIFVDSGSYVYTPSRKERNAFRSVQAHSTFYLEGHEPVVFNDHLFSLDIPEQTFLSEWEHADPWLLTTSHTLSKKQYNFTAHRTVKYHQEVQELCITDVWKAAQGYDHDLFGCWNFILNPALTVRKQENTFLFSYEGQEIAQFTSTIPFEVKDCFVSPSYGTKVPSKKLCSRVSSMYNDPLVTTVTMR